MDRPDPIGRRAAGGLTVVTGLPRSGTSLMMQMLRAGGVPIFSDDSRPADRDNPRGYWEHAAVRATRRDASWVRRAEGRAVKVVIPLLCDLPAGPAYRVIAMRRPLEEVAASQRRMLRGRGEAPDPREEPRLIEAFRRELARAERWLAARARTLWLSHAEVVTEPGRAAAAVDAFLGGGLDRSAMVSCVDPALRREGRGAGP